MSRANSRPVVPPIHAPPANSNPLNAPSRIAVLSPFIYFYCLTGKSQATSGNLRRTWLGWPDQAVQPPLSVVAYSHFHLSRLSNLLLWQGDRQRAALVVGLDSFRIHRIRQREHAL